MSHATSPQNDMLCVGVIANAHGIQGCVKIKAFNADPNALDRFNTLFDEETQTPIEIGKIVSVKGDLVIARLKGIDDRNAAEALKGHKLMVPRADLPELEDEDEFYHTDLLGLTINTVDGKLYGTVIGLHNFGASDMLEVDVKRTGKNEFIPFTKAVIPTITSDQLVIDLDALTYVIAKEDSSDE